MSGQAFDEVIRIELPVTGTKRVQPGVGRLRYRLFQISAKAGGDLAGFRTGIVQKMRNPFDQGYYETAELREMGFGYVGEGVRVAKNNSIPILQNIHLGDGVRIDGFCTIIANGPLRIGAYVHIHTSVLIGSRGGIEIGEYAAVSHSCQLLSSSDDFTGKWMTNSTLPPGCTRPKTAPIVLGRHVPVGAGCTILPGVTVGEGAAICAHSLVTRNMPEWMMCIGVPARPRVPRHRNVLELAKRLVDSPAQDR